MAVALSTDLDAAECLSRLSESGWSRSTTLPRWEPAKRDRSILRRVDGSVVRLTHRSAPYYVSPVFGEDYGWYYVATVAREGDGTRIALRLRRSGYETALFLLVAPATVAGLAFLALLAISPTLSAPEERVVFAIGLALIVCLSAVALAVRLARGRRSGRAREVVLRYVAEVLEARTEPD